MGGANSMNTRDRILSCGRKSFLACGFKGAPLRRIVADAGVTTGAFYGYFVNKEELFYALTDEAAEGLMELLNAVAREMDALPVRERLFRMCGVYIERIPEIVDYLLEHRDEMRLIIACSQGTKYEGFLDSLQRRNEVNISQSAVAATMSDQDIQPLSPETVSLLMDGYFSILAKLILEEDDREHVVRSMTEVARVFEAGIVALMREVDAQENTTPGAAAHVGIDPERK